MSITHVFFDVGGVLGTNGWDRGERAAAARHFGLEPDDLEELHGEAVAMLEMGRMTLDEYLKTTVFYCARPFAPGDFKRFMFAQSTPHPESIELARGLARSGRYTLMTLNNESAETPVPCPRPAATSSCGRTRPATPTSAAASSSA